MCNAFLMEQMHWRESLDEADDEESIDRLHAEVQARQRGLFETVARALDDAPDAPRAAEAVRSLMFVARFLQDIERRRDALFPL
jgi:molecular chaperone HscB